MQESYNAAIDMWSAGCIFVVIAIQCHLGRAAADAGARDEGAAAVSGEDLLSTQRREEGTRPQREAGRGVPRRDAPADENLRRDRHAGEVGLRRRSQRREDVEGLDEGPMKTVVPAGRAEK